MIRGGYYIKSRCIKGSAVNHAPPYVREIWDYLLREANHCDKKYNGFTVKRGQLFRSYRQIREDLCWYVGYRKEMYNENQTKRGMRYLTKELMITTMKEPRGVLITVCNYDHFQNPKNYERTNEGANERTNDEPMTNHTGLSINKNVKNVKNDKNDKNKRFIVPTIEEIEKYCKERNNQVNPLTFIDHYKSNGWMVGKNKMKDWKAAIRTWEQRNYGGNNGRTQGSTGAIRGKTEESQSDGQPYPVDAEF